VWEVSDKQQFVEVRPVPNNNGESGSFIPIEMGSHENARMNLQALLPKLKPCGSTYAERSAVTNVFPLVERLFMLGFRATLLAH
jgi:hypothetical protein